MGLTKLEKLHLSLKRCLRVGLELISVEEGDSPLFDEYFESFSKRLTKIQNSLSSLDSLEMEEGSIELKESVDRQLKLLRTIIEMFENED